MGFKETEISLLFNPCSIYSFTKLQNLAQEQLQTQEPVSLHFLRVTSLVKVFTLTFWQISFYSQWFAIFKTENECKFL